MNTSERSAQDMLLDVLGYGSLLSLPGVAVGNNCGQRALEGAIVRGRLLEDVTRKNELDIL